MKPIMLEKGKINAGEFYLLVITFTIGTSVLILPALLASFARQSAWISSAFATLISLFFIYIYNQLATLYPSMTYVELNEKILGKWLGKITALLYIIYFFIITFTLLLEIGNFFTTEVLADTPIEIIMMIFLLTSLIGVRLGLEVISRTLLIFFPWIVILLVMLFLFLIPEIKLVNIQPILEVGIKPIIKGIYHNLGVPYVELVLFLMITPYVIKKAKMKKAFYSGALIGGLTLTIFVIFSILVLGADLTSRQTYPSYMLGKKISIGHFLERIEVIVAIIWVLTIYFKLTLSFYGTALGLAQVLGLKNYQILLFPLALLIIPLSIISYPNIVYFNLFSALIWPSYSITIGFFMPLLLLVIGKIRKKRSSSKDSNL